MSINEFEHHKTIGDLSVVSSLSLIVLIELWALYQLEKVKPAGLHIVTPLEIIKPH